MTADVLRLRLLLVFFAGWIGRHEQELIEYLVEENRVLREQVAMPNGAALRGDPRWLAAHENRAVSAVCVEPRPVRRRDPLRAQQATEVQDDGRDLLIPVTPLRVVGLLL